MQLTAGGKKSHIIVRGIVVKQKHNMGNDLWEAVGQLWRLLALQGPCLECNGQNLQSHDEGRETQAHGEGEHRIDFVIFHGLDDVAGLVRVSISFRQGSHL